MGTAVGKGRGPGFLGLQDVQGHNHPRQTELSSASVAAPALARKFGMKKLHE